MMLAYSVCLTSSQVFLHLDHNICLQVYTQIITFPQDILNFVSFKKVLIFDLVILKSRITSTLSRSFLSMLFDKQ